MGKIKYTTEIVAAIKAECKNRTSADIADIINARFKTDFTAAGMCSYMSEHRILTGLQPWKKHVTKQCKPIGAEKKKGGYIYLKVAQPNVWALKHYTVWEKCTGHKVQKDEQIIFLDGNKENTSIENLYMVKRRIMRILNTHYPKRAKGCPEKTITYILLAKIKAAEIDNAIKYKKLTPSGSNGFVHGGAK